MSEKILSKSLIIRKIAKPADLYGKISKFADLRRNSQVWQHCA